MSDVELEIVDNEFLRQFETTIDGQKSKIEYAQQERKIFLNSKSYKLYTLHRCTRIE